jgi:hypothetical protein
VNSSSCSFAELMGFCRLLRQDQDSSSNAVRSIQSLGDIDLVRFECPNMLSRVSNNIVESFSIVMMRKSFAHRKLHRNKQPLDAMV